MVGFGVRVERAGPESPLTVTDSVQDSSCVRDVSEAFGKMGEKQAAGEMVERKDVGLRIKDFSGRARSSRLLPTVPGSSALQGGAH